MGEGLPFIFAVAALFGGDLGMSLSIEGLQAPGTAKGDTISLVKVSQQGQSAVPVGSEISGELVEPIRIGEPIKVGSNGVTTDWTSPVDDVQNNNGVLQFVTRSGAVYEMQKR